MGGKKSVTWADEQAEPRPVGITRAHVELCKEISNVLIVGAELTPAHEDSILSLIGGVRMGGMLTLHSALRENPDIRRLLVQIMVYNTGVDNYLKRMVYKDITVGIDIDSVEKTLLKTVIGAITDVLTPGEEWDFSGDEDEEWCKMSFCVGYLNSMLDIA